MSDKSDRSGVVVYMEKVPVMTPRNLPHPAIRQREKMFFPRVVAVEKGGAVDFPNDDKIFHNVFSLSQPSKFDLGLYKSGISKTVTFDRPGVVDIYCNIHPEMAATVRVLDTAYFAVTVGDGSFQIGDVPPGTYPVSAWLPRGDEYHGTVTVAAGATATLAIEVKESASEGQHTRKDGTPYGRYE